MCPNCIKGLVQGELCEQCKGTGFWNPESLSVKEVENMEHESETALAADSVVGETVETPQEPVELAPTDVTPVEATETTPEVAMSEPVEIPADAGVQAPVSEEPKDEVVA